MFFRNYFQSLANCNEADSASNQFRKKRFLLFKELITPLLGKPLKILDVGGTTNFWEQMDFFSNDVHITLLNLEKIEINHPNFTCVQGDARNMPQFTDKSFDLVFSNSVIEHVGTYEDQKRMANEVQRIGKRYFIQTPNYYFPLEPHFLTPGFQFLPIKIRALLLRHFDLGWYDKIENYQESISIAKHIRLLSQSELKYIFPDTNVFREKFIFLTKSFVVYQMQP